MTYKAVWCSPQSARKNWESIKSLINEFIKSNELSMHVEFVTPEILELKNEIESLRQRLTESEARSVGLLDQVLAGIAREQSYREHREDQDGSAIGACKEIAGYVRAMKASDSETPNALLKVLREVEAASQGVSATLRQSASPLEDGDMDGECNDVREMATNFHKAMASLRQMMGEK